MKNLNLFSILAIFTLSVSVNAQSNPQIRVCNLTGGAFNVAATENDQVGLCKFDLAYVGTIDLLNFHDRIQAVQSIQTYIDGIQSCEPYGQMKIVTLLAGASVSVCVFNDGTMIEADTLKKGRYDSSNVKLNKALGLHF